MSSGSTGRTHRHWLEGVCERSGTYHALLAAFFELTGVPMVLNTSFNDREPIVATPEDAITTFLRTGMHALFLEDRLVLRPS